MAYFLHIDNEPKFSLTKFNAAEFNGSMTLYIQGDDLKQLKNVFTDFHNIAVYKNDIQLMYSDSFDGYSNIAFNSSVFCDEEQKFCDELAITLTKKNIVDKILALENQINPVIDFDSLTLNESKNVIKNQINEDCQNAIYSGIDVQLTSGDYEHFSLTQNDQANISSLASLILRDPTITALPYHGDGKLCSLYDAKSILTLYMQMQLKVTEETTHCNLIKSYIDSLTEKEEVLDVTYETPLTDELQGIYDNIIAASLAVMQKMTEQLGNTGSTEEPKDDASTDPSTEEPEIDNTDSNSEED